MANSPPAGRVFDARASGDEARMPFQVKGFGMLADRCGTPWTIGGGPARRYRYGPVARAKSSIVAVRPCTLAMRSTGRPRALSFCANATVVA
jgi:hypothetical protein